MKSVANECATLFAGISLLAPGLGLVLKHNPQWGIPVWWFLPYGAGCIGFCALSIALRDCFALREEERKKLEKEANQSRKEWLPDPDPLADNVWKISEDVPKKSPDRLSGGEDGEYLTITDGIASFLPPEPQVAKIGFAPCPAEEEKRDDVPPLLLSHVHNHYRTPYPTQLPHHDGIYDHTGTVTVRVPKERGPSNVSRKELREAMFRDLSYSWEEKVVEKREVVVESDSGIVTIPVQIHPRQIEPEANWIWHPGEDFNSIEFRWSQNFYRLLEEKREDRS